MLRSLKDLENYKVYATDGEVGSVVKFLFDDERWVVRYLVVETGGFLERSRVLISPISFEQADWSTQRFHLALTAEKVKNSPNVDLDKPVSRQQERGYSGYYDYPNYWGYSGIWGMGAYPAMLSEGSLAESAVPGKEDSGDSSSDVHLRSDEEVRGYHVQGSDEAIGHIEDFIVDDKTWEVHYLVVNTRNWWFGKSVLVAPQWASRISWDERKVYVDLPREAIKNSPEWNSSDIVNRDYETRLHDHYGRTGYWEGGASAMTSDQLMRAPALQQLITPQVI